MSILVRSSKSMERGAKSRSFFLSGILPKSIHQIAQINFENCEVFVASEGAHPPLKFLELEFLVQFLNFLRQYISRYNHIIFQKSIDNLGIVLKHNEFRAGCSSPLRRS